ncbi:MAG: hypothetical protein JAZ19_03695 [Candidatus Thiodiazotropha taylori]|nr:hypothetical protein [Candidatus Thiodiazotropha taylori]
MTTKQKQTEKKLRNKTGKDDQVKALVKARKAIKPSIHAAIAIAEYDRYYGEFDLSSLIDALEEQVDQVEQGDLSRSDAMLTTQAHTLDAIFNHLARRALHQEYINQMDVFLKLALRAQSQCRSTWEALSRIKNPPVMGYIGQANIAHGPQQVNNSLETESRDSDPDQGQNLQNKLLEENDGQRVDTRTTSASGQTDSAMAAMGAVKRPKKSSR